MHAARAPARYLAHPHDEDEEALPHPKDGNVTVVVVVAIAGFAVFLVLCWLAARCYARRHRARCARKMEELLIDTALVQMMLFETSDPDRIEQSNSAKSQISNSPARKLWKNVLSLSSLRRTKLRQSVFSNWTDGRCILDKPFVVASSVVRVVICFQGERATVEYEHVAVRALQSLCAQHHLDILGVCFCILGDVPQDGMLRLTGGVGRSSSRLPSRVEVPESDDGSTCPVELLPVICDVADYCLLVREPVEVTSEESTETIVPLERKTLQPTESDNAICEKSKVARHSRTRITMEGNKSCEIIINPLVERDKGAASFLVGLSILALKDDNEAFVIRRGGNYELEHYKDYKHELSFGWKFCEDLQDMNLQAPLLRLWALAVSHGSHEFISKAKPCLYQMQAFAKMSLPLRPICCCASRARRRRFQVSYIELLLNIFSLHRRDAPIVPIAHFTGEPYGTKEHVKKACRHDFLHERTDMETSLVRRKGICRAARLKYLFREAHFQAKGGTNFRPPSKEPCVSHLAKTAGDFDDIFEHSNEQLLPKMNQYITLEDLAVRIREYYISFLRNLNGDPSSESGLRSAADARRALCETYTTAAEGSGHVVDHVRKYLCEIAEPQSYKQLLTEIRAINRIEKLEERSRMSHCVEVEIVGALNLRNAETAAVFNVLNKSDPYCTVQLGGKRWSKLSTKVIYDTLDPVWNFSGVLEDYDFGDDLIFQVWDYDRTNFDDLLGSALLSGGIYERGTFEGTLMLSEVKGHSGAKLQVRARVVKSNKPAPILPRPRSLQEVLERIHLVHFKLQRAMRHTAHEASEECEQNDVPGARRIIHSGSKTGLWQLIQSSAANAIEKQMLQAPIREEHLERMSKSNIGLVDELLRSMGGAGFDLDSIPDKLPFACHTVTCDSFAIMRYVLQMLRESHAIDIHSVKESWRERMNLPQISISASLSDCKVEGHPHMVNIVIQHSKIVALVESTENWSSSIDILRDVPVMCQNLRMQDPHTHPSRWCLSFGQLKELAKKAEEALGPDVYAEATMTDVVMNYIWKLTEEARMSYACLMNWKKLRDIDIFVSHAWKENFPRFVQSVGQALSQRLEADETSLWICSLALFQTENKELVKAQIGGDLMDAPFDKALRHAKEVLVVRNSKIDNYQRAWCVYEIFRARQLALKITIAGPDTFKGGAVDIMRCVASDPTDEKNIKNAISSAGLVDELNSIVTEIKNKGCGNADDYASQQLAKLSTQIWARGRERRLEAI